MAKNVHLTIANTLHFADHNRSAEDLCVGSVDAMFAGIDFRYAYPVECYEKEKFTDKFFDLVCKEIKKRKNNGIYRKAQNGQESE